MAHILDFLLRHGPTVLFAAVFVEQMGAPIPASPWLLAAGALSATGDMHWYSSLLAAACGAVFADAIWFNLGRRGGNRVLNFLCRISLEPDSCVRRTEDLYGRYGLKGMLVVKFIPGLNTVAAPLAGSSGARAYRFFLFDTLGAFLYAGAFIVVGAIFKRQLDQVIAALANLGGGAVALVAGLLALYIGYKFYQRRRLLKELRATRITVDELHQQLEAGKSPVILDLRSNAEVKRDPEFIRGARHVTIEELKAMQHEIPRDREIVLYCSCPNEVTSARMALVLRRNGITHVRPLLGGIDAWRERKYPIDSHLAAVAISAPEPTNKNP